MNTEVTGCNNCPLVSYQDEMMYWSCLYPTKGDFISIDTKKGSWNTPITPSNCPLKNESITITFKVI